MSGSFPPSKHRSRSTWLVLSAAWLVAALAGSAQQPGSRIVGGYSWELPANFPVPAVPADNPMSADKVALGKRLFFDTRLSANEAMACATCHDPARAFTDGLAQPVGITGERLPRNAPSFSWPPPMRAA